MGEGGQGRCSSGSTGVNRAATLPPIGKLSLGKSNVSLDNAPQVAREVSILRT